MGTWRNQPLQIPKFHNIKKKKFKIIVCNIKMFTHISTSLTTEAISVGVVQQTVRRSLKASAAIKTLVEDHEDLCRSNKKYYNHHHITF